MTANACDLPATARAFVLRAMAARDALAENLSDVEFRKRLELPEPQSDPAETGTEKPSRRPHKLSDRERVALAAENLEADLRRQMGKAARARPDLREFVDDAFYAMAAAADEIALFETNEIVARLWEENLIERRVFGTCASGDWLWDRISTMPARPRTPDNGKLALVYLLAVGSGFRGSLRNGVRKSVKERVKALAMFVEEAYPDGLSTSGPICPEAYSNPVIDGPSDRLPLAQRWWYATATVLIVFLALAFLDAYLAKRKLRDAVNEIAFREIGESIAYSGDD